MPFPSEQKLNMQRTAYIRWKTRVATGLDKTKRHSLCPKTFCMQVWYNETAGTNDLLPRKIVLTAFCTFGCVGDICGNHDLPSDLFPTSLVANDTA